MRLTNILMFYVRRRHVPGKITIGKNRVEPPVTCAKKTKAMKQMVAEQRNLDVLSRPYISEVEDHNHEWEMGLVQEKRRLARIEQIEKKWIPHRTMDFQMDNLKKHSGWE